MVVFVAPFYVCIRKERGENCVDAEVFDHCTQNHFAAPPKCVAEEQMLGLASSLGMVFAFSLTADQIQEQPQQDQTPSPPHHHSGRVVVPPPYRGKEEKFYFSLTKNK